MKKGDTITYQAAGDQRAKHVPGDIVFRINEAEHHMFKRKGDNLLTTLKISLKEALLGFSRDIQHLSGNVVKIKHQGIVHPGMRFVVEGEGRIVVEVECGNRSTLCG